MSSDLRNTCTPVRNQLQCGSCTAFGTIAAWEQNIKVLFNQLLDLSERHLFSCSGGTCETGNTMDKVFNTAKDYGVALEECCPYDGVDHLCSDVCKDWYVNGKKLKQWRTIKNIEEMKTLLKTKCLVTTMTVYQSFINYKEGVYHKLNNDSLLGYHAICVCGYNDTLQAWLLKNSWGTNWGLNGYAYIKYGECNIDDEMYELMPDTEPPNPTPVPSPCKVGNFITKLLNVWCYLFKRKGRFYYMNKR